MKTLFRTLFLLFISILFSTNINAQEYWKRTYGTSENEKPVSAVNLADGNFNILCASSDIHYLMTINGAGSLLNRDTLVGKEPITMKPLSNGDFMVYGLTTDLIEYQRPFLSRYDEFGNELWTNYYRDTLELGGFINYVRPTTISDHDFAELSDGSLILQSGYYSGPWADVHSLYTKIDGEGNIIWEKLNLIGNIGIGYYLFKLIPSADGLLVSAATDLFAAIGKLDADGNVIWQETFDFNDSWLDIKAATPEGGAIAISGNHFYKLDPNGMVIDSFPYENYPRELLLLDDGSYISTFEIDEVQNVSDTDFAIERIFPPANATWQQRRFFKPNNQRPAGIISTTDGGYLIIGTTISPFTGSDIYIIKVDGEGFSNGHLLTGTIIKDDNQNCESDSLEISLSNFVVIAEGSENGYAITDLNGNYVMELSPGTYDIQALPPNNYWEFCNNSPGTLLDSIGNTTTVDFEAQAVVDCPVMEIDISTPLLRRCFPNNYYVSYCNNGTAIAENVSVEVVLDDFMVVDSTSIPISFNQDSLYVFDLGSVNFLECGSFVIYTTLDPFCGETELGETHCVEAHIFPDSFCLVNSSWSGADIELAAECDPDSLSFFIQNNGTGNMNQPLNFVIIEDEVIRHEGTFELDAGEMRTEKVPANGATYRMEAEQEPFHPVTKQVSITVEGCGQNSSGGISLGFVNLFPNGDDAPYLSIDCKESIGSFDPNDKQGFPLGYGDENYIYQNVPIDYMIRFQNTGTDTAFRVVIVDTISEYLNPASIVPGASSHDYEYSLSENGIATFTFDNILLPDSNVNEVLSNGFVKFKIDQFPNNPIGTDIYNSAAIYFDFNEPVITNTTHHRIGESLLTTIVIDPTDSTTVNVLVYPNPFKEQTIFEVEGPEIPDLKLSIYNAIGQLVRMEYFDDNTLQFHRELLNTGIYFYQITNETERLSSGRIFIE